MKNRNPSRDNGCCSAHFLKYLLFIFNFLFYIAGLGILGIGVWTLFWKSHYVVLLASSWYMIITYILIGAGVLVIIGGVLGCCGVLREDRCCLFMFALFLLLIFVLEAGAGTIAYIYQDKIEQELNENLERTLMNKYSKDETITNAADKLMREHKCCGARGFQDWKNPNSEWFKTVNYDASSNQTVDRSTVLAVPDVCCISVTDNCGKKDHPSNIYYNGCIEKLKNLIRRHELIIGAIALGICNIQLFGLIVTCCLFYKFKDYIPMKRQQQSRRERGYYNDD